MAREYYGYYLECGAGEMANAYKAAKQWITRGNQPQVGDVVFFDWDENGWANHVGIVETVNGVILGIIEGNNSEAVIRTRYGYNNTKIMGYGVPNTTQGNRLAVVEQAASWVGYNEADGSFKDIIDVYNADTPLARGYKVKYTDEWCATFVSACAIAVHNKSNTVAVKPIPVYVVRRDYLDRNSQLGTYKVLNNAKKKADANPGFGVYTYPDGELVYRSALPVAQDRYYIVQKGDTLWKIAMRYYGSGAKYRKIMTANSLTSTVINVGQKLVIPEE